MLVFAVIATELLILVGHLTLLMIRILLICIAALVVAGLVMVALPMKLIALAATSTRR